ncbi:MAG: hypothetical protein B7Z66_05720 [Chromatiales bacterium 21-64-14]|nr:MAG: hypothetical protein B7Z66_05720 [Chromatiales bacterium 21-64-14]HQU15200.1 retropepsin-like aspartic protease [Gammaproteobacteria bacterium]
MRPQPKLKALVFLGLAMAVLATQAGQFGHTIPMIHRGASTYYVGGDITGYGKVEFMVDTGSGYMTINEDTLAVLQRSGDAVYVKDLTGIMADGTRRTVPVYRIKAVTLGGDCVLHNVDAAVFPQRTRLLLGLSALEKTAPFVFSTNPPKLVLSHCATTS